MQCLMGKCILGQQSVGCSCTVLAPAKHLQDPTHNALSSVGAGANHITH